MGAWKDELLDLLLQRGPGPVWNLDEEALARSSLNSTKHPAVSGVAAAVVLRSGHQGLVDFHDFGCHYSILIDVEATDNTRITIDVVLADVPHEVAPVYLCVWAHPTRLEVAVLQQPVTAPSIGEEEDLLDAEVRVVEERASTDGLGGVATGAFP